MHLTVNDQLLLLPLVEALNVTVVLQVGAGVHLAALRTLPILTGGTVASLILLGGVLRALAANRCA